jgi:hypothetical protein
MTEPLRLKGKGLPEQAVRELENWGARLVSELKSVLSSEGQVSRQALTNLASQITSNFDSLVSGFALPSVEGASDSQLDTLSTATGTVEAVSFSATPASVFDTSVANPTTSPAISLAMDNQTQNKVLASPNGSTGQPAFRALVDADVPDALTVNGGTIENTPVGASTAATGKFTTVDSTSSEYRANGTKVLGAQGASVADASGGATVDTEARAAINALLARARAHGWIAT